MNKNASPLGLPNPVAPLNALIEQTLTVADLVSVPLWTIDPRGSAADAAASLAARDFDIVGLAADPITHYVRRDELVATTGRLKTAARPILASDCVEKSLPLAELLERMSAVEHVFVLDNDRVRWVVTRADLQAPAVGVVVLAYLTVIETGLRIVVLDELGDGWFERLSPERQALAVRNFGQKRANNVAIGLEHCLYLGDWLTLAATSEGVRERIGFTSRKKFCGATSAFDVLRNDLAHGGTILDSAGSDPSRSLRRVARVRTFAERVWIEVGRTSQLWDVYASTVLRLPKARSPFTGSGARSDLPDQPPLYAITAWNPGSVWHSFEANQQANEQLVLMLERRGHQPRRVLGSSPDGKWQEESLLVSGMRRERAAELGGMFGQVAVFEITQDELRVISCLDAAVMRSQPRVRPRAG